MCLPATIQDNKAVLARTSVTHNTSHSRATSPPCPCPTSCTWARNWKPNIQSPERALAIGTPPLSTRLQKEKSALDLLQQPNNRPSTLISTSLLA
jgi:hypothetical protein